MDIQDYITKNWFSVLIWAITALILLWLVATSWHRVVRFCREVWGELLKCSWPWEPQQTGFRRYKQLIDSTVVVIVSTVLLAAYVTFSDFVLVKVVGFLTRYHA
jgi:preprotein translocase subunit SecE